MLHVESCVSRVTTPPAVAHKLEETAVYSDVFILYLNITFTTSQDSNFAQDSRARSSATGCTPDRRDRRVRTGTESGSNIQKSPCPVLRLSSERIGARLTSGLTGGVRRAGCGPMELSPQVPRSRVMPLER